MNLDRVNSSIGPIWVICVILASAWPTWAFGQALTNVDGLLAPYTERSQGRSLKLPGSGHRVGAVSFNSDGSRLIVGSDDGLIHFYDPTSGRQLNPKLKIGMTPIHALTIGPGDRLLAIAASDGELSGDSVSIWLDNRVKQRSLSRLPGEVIALAFAADGQTLGAIDHQYNVRVWRVDTGDEVLNSAIHRANGRRPDSPSTQANFSADLRRALIVNKADDVPFVEGPPNKIVRLWEAESQRPRIFGYDVGTRITAAIIRSDGSQFVTASEVQNVFYYDFATARMLRGDGFLPFDPESRLTFLMLSANNRFVVFATKRAVVAIDDLDDKLNGLHRFIGPHGYVRAGAFRPKGARFASGGWEVLGDEKIAGTDLPKYEPVTVWEVEVDGM